ncbi:VWA domain-containing protein [Flavobacterium sp. MXW15]|uniref:VWA domain-containing protein n=1 Tax=Xanthomonas chitinilytica TaxID=2989819 RepID=A0ABT3JY08_9XANT|nr:VWA domain-containing protein [Xanthomonas sp. H13-6]MCW4455534.1 VWA domain-containing protein [Flavobacterium sp. MXW15]MCW4473385.1 VWA domain-containing protein [Xanthomonas sp. H13-6]
MPGMEALAPWRDAWADALASWSRHTRLQDPRLCGSSIEAAKEGLTASFAMIRLADQRVVIDLEGVARWGLDGYEVEILAHEIGHHVLAPATATDHARLLARMRRALPTLEAHAPMVANLYTDLLINDRLQRRCGLRMADIYRQLALAKGGSGTSAVWALYMGIYEQLWQLPAGSLGGPVEDAVVRGDAWLGARLVRVYAGDWLEGGGRFATLLLSHLVEDAHDPRVEALMDTRHAGQGSRPAGLDRIEEDELAPATHPAMDPRITGEEPPEAQDVAGSGKAPPLPGEVAGESRGQAREPFEYGEILRSAGLDLSDHELAVRYYRERALPHLIRFPASPQPEALEPQLEGLEPWEPGDPLDALDWMQTLLQSPRVVPGLTTVQRSYGLAPGREPDPQPVDLDLYVDSSGSMPNPQTHTSWLALAGAVVALSALRAGSRVQATLWSGKAQLVCTDGFVRSEDAILRVLTGFFGGATAFPIHRLRETYARRTPHDRAVHILHLSDDGITTMFERDERGNSGWDIAAHALRTARAGGTMALNLHAPLAGTMDWQADLRRAQVEGWDIHAVRDMAGLLAFARDFSRRHYGGAAAGRAA